jgi:hypothetical protein
MKEPIEMDKKYFKDLTLAILILVGFCVLVLGGSIVLARLGMGWPN